MMGGMEFISWKLCWQASLGFSFEGIVIGG